MSELTSILARERAVEATRWELPKVGRDQRAANPLQPERPTVAELQRLEDQARQEGFEQGLAEGRAEARRERDAQAAQLATLFDALARPLRDVDHEVEEALVDLAVRIARRVVAHELDAHPAEHMTALVHRLVDMLPASGQTVTIHLHPDDAALLRESLGEAGERGWVLKDDPAIARGGCRLESGASHLDAPIEARLDAAIDAALQTHHDGDGA